MPALRAKDFTPGVPKELLLRDTEPRQAPDNGFGIAMKFDTSIGTIYLDPEPAHDIVEQIRELGVGPNEPVRIVRIRTSHGGHRWHIERPNLERQLVDSLEMRRARPTAIRSIGSPEREPPETPEPGLTTARALEHQPKKDGVQPAASDPNLHQSNGSAETTRITPTTAKFMAAYMAAIDTLIEARTYAQRKGLALEVRCEDVRCLASTIVIDQKGGAR